MIDQLGGRKYIAFFFIAILFTILLILGKDTQTFMAFISTIYGLFVLGNVGENLTKK